MDISHKKLYHKTVKMSTPFTATVTPGFSL